MPLVLPLVPGQRTTPETVVVEEVRRFAAAAADALVAICVLTTKRCSRRLRLRRSLAEVGRVAKRFELGVEHDAYSRNTVTSFAAPIRRSTSSSSFEV